MKGILTTYPSILVAIFSSAALCYGQAIDVHADTVLPISSFNKI